MYSESNVHGAWLYKWLYILYAIDMNETNMALSSAWLANNKISMNMC